MSKEEYDWIGVWVLASIHLVQEQSYSQELTKADKKMVFPKSLTKYKNLFEIVFAGDFINHSIFLASELIDGITRLTKRGFIEEKDGFLITTEKTVKLYKEATSKMKRVSRDTALRIFAKILQTKLPYE